MSTTINERLAVVEIQVEHLGDAQEEVLRKLCEMQATLNEYSSTITKYKGFVGGILFIVSCISAFLVKFGQHIWHVIGLKNNG